MTKYWIIVASKEHVEKGVEGGFAQACHGKATPLKKMHNGDYVIYYSSKRFFNKPEPCQAFTAIGTVINDCPYQVEMAPNFHPFRIDIAFFPAQEVPIAPLINSLACIPNKQKWGYPFRWGTLAISESDFRCIANLMLHDTKPIENLHH